MLFMRPYYKETQIKYSKTISSELFYGFDAFKNKNVSEAERKIIANLRNIGRQVNSICNISEENQANKNMSIKWYFAAKLMDRLFLCVSLIYFVFTFSVLILGTKNFYYAY